jgi:hypothetical protein
MSNSRYNPSRQGVMLGGLSVASEMFHYSKDARGDRTRCLQIRGSTLINARLVFSEIHKEAAQSRKEEHAPAYADELRSCTARLIRCMHGGAGWVACGGTAYR